MTTKKTRRSFAGTPEVHQRAATQSAAELRRLRKGMANALHPNGGSCSEAMAKLLKAFEEAGRMSAHQEQLRAGRHRVARSPYESVSRPVSKVLVGMHKQFRRACPLPSAMVPR